jgi:hypothetical protein
VGSGGLGHVEHAICELTEVRPGGADRLDVDFASQHAGMLVELTEAVAPSVIGNACAHVGAACLLPR